MRIGLDMLAVQLPGLGSLEDGRYCRHLVSALLARDDGSQYILYAHDSLPNDPIPTAPAAEIRRLGHGPGTTSRSLEELARTNPDALDVLVIPSPFERRGGYRPPGPPSNGLKLVAVVSDLIPFLLQSEDGYDEALMGSYRTLETLRRYDALLTISETSRADWWSLLGLPDGRVFNIGAADDGLWEPVADRAARVLADLPARRPSSWRRDARHCAHKPRIAFVSPLPPRKTGISDYSITLLGELKRFYAIDLYHDGSYIPAVGLADDEFACRDIRHFDRFAAELDYHAVVYQMGNSHYHAYLYETMLRVPGVVTLHDFCLAGFHLHFAQARGLGRESFRDELLTWYPEDAETIAARLESWAWDPEQVARGCAREGWFLNLRLLSSENLVVVHSPWCLERVRDTRPGLADRMVVIPQGAVPRCPSESERGAIRDRFGIPRDALVFASLGFIHPVKMSPRRSLPSGTWREEDPSALFVFVGEDADGGRVRRHAETLGLGDRVRFLGRRSISEFADLASVADVGVNLRRPPTNGETSAALLSLLSSGVATIVTDVDTFSDYPGHVVRKVRWESEGFEGLRRAMLDLAGDHRARAALGRAAWEYVREHHEWPRVAGQYVEVIERSHAAQNQARRRPFLVG